jgi:phosphate ABC transporter phosphate-binding protein
MIATTCPACGYGLELTNAKAGQTIPCPQCGQPVALNSSGLAGKGDTRFLGPGSGPQSARATDPKDMGETLVPGAGTAKPELRTFDFLSPPLCSDDGIGWLAHYRVLKLLGSGGMGLVFHAEDTQLDRPVALKVVRPTIADDQELRQRFLREARTTAAVKSDYIVTIFQVGQHNNLPFLAMEFLQGEPLDEALKRNPKPDVSFVLRVGQEIALGLAAAHERGLIHRDIKPANIFLEAPSGRVKILDFGLARPALAKSELTQPGTIIGTPEYMAPEQAEGDAVSQRSDLFSLGCVLYRMLSGEKPFDGPTVLAVLKAVALKEPRPIAEVNRAVPPALAALVGRLMAKDPARRPQSAREVADALDAIARDPSVSLSQIAPPAPALRRWVPAGAWIAFLVLALGVGTLGAFLVSRNADSGAGSSAHAVVNTSPTTPGNVPPLIPKKETGFTVRPAAFTLNGGGSSLVAPLLEKWATVYQKEKNIRINYVPTGSGAGIQQFMSQALDFACTEAPLTEEQLKQAQASGDHVMYVPISLGGVVPAYNLAGIARPLRFSGLVLARIYLGEITRWNDPAVREINPGVDFPDQEITVLHRADSSGSSYVFTDFLSKVSKDWQQKIGTSTAPKWPVGVGARRNEGMVESLQKKPGAIAYVDLLDALQSKLQFGSVKNRAGNYILASLETVVATTEAAVPDVPDDLRFSLTYAPGKESYPICGCTWIIIYARQSDGNGQRLVNFLRWVTQDGQEYNTDLFYARLPQKLADKVQQRLDQVKFGE